MFFFKNVTFWSSVAEGKWPKMVCGGVHGSVGACTGACTGSCTGAWERVRERARERGSVNGSVHGSAFLQCSKDIISCSEI